MNRLRIIHLTTTASPIAGAEKILLDIARTAHNVNWELMVCTLSARGHLHDELESAGVPTRAFGIRSYGDIPRALASIHTNLAKFRPHILHTHLFHASVMGAAATLIRPSVSLVQTRHYADYISRFQSRRLSLDAWAARRADRVIAVSEAAKSHLIAKERVQPSAVHVISNGVDWPHLSRISHSDARAALSRLGVSLEGPVLGCAASFGVCKGHKHLIEALPSILRQHAKAQLVLLGDGPERQPIHDLVAAQKLNAHVHFLGHRPDATTLIAGLDVYVQPSIEEGFGLALVEAMATGRAVVATNVGGMSQIVEHGSSGLLIQPGSPRDISDAVLSVLASPANATRLGNNASKRVQACYALDQVVEQYDRVYRSISSESLAER